MSQGQISADLAALSGDAHGLDNISQEQSGILHALAGTMDTLAVALKVTSPSGAACAAMGERLHADGMLFVSQFSDNSEKMTKNASFHQNADDDATHILNQVQTLT
jgi:hypothetical protein